MEKAWPNEQYHKDRGRRPLWWPLKYILLSLNSSNDVKKKTKNVWVWEDVANRRTVLNCQSSAMWLKSSALWAARVWSNNYKIDGYFIGCWRLSVTYTAKLLVLGDVGTEKQELYIYLKYWVTKSAITHLTETKPRLATVMYCMGTDLTPPPPPPQGDI